MRVVLFVTDFDELTLYRDGIYNYSFSWMAFSYLYLCVLNLKGVLPNWIITFKIILCRCDGCLLLWNGHPLKCRGFPVDVPVPFSPVHSARKFSAVLGVISANSSKTIRPATDRKQINITILHRFTHRFWVNYLHCSLCENSLDLVTTWSQHRENHYHHVVVLYCYLPR